MSTKEISKSENTLVGTVDQSEWWVACSFYVTQRILPVFHEIHCVYIVFLYIRECGTFLAMIFRAAMCL